MTRRYVKQGEFIHQIVKCKVKARECAGPRREPAHGSGVIAPAPYAVGYFWPFAWKQRRAY